MRIAEICRELSVAEEFSPALSLCDWHKSDFFYIIFACVCVCVCGSESRLRYARTDLVGFELCVLLNERSLTFRLMESR